jgi:hypothetical protein
LEKFVSRAKTKKLGVVFSENVNRAEKYLSGVADKLSGVNPFAKTDGDPAYFKQELDKVLRKRFSDVVFSAALSPLKTSTDVQLIVDYRTKLGWYSGTVTRAQIGGILVDSKGAEISRMQGKGESTVPFPAMTLRYQDTVDQALGVFAENLDRVLR